MAPRENILGIGVSAINMDDAVEIISNWIDKAERQYVCVTGVHGIMESRRSERIRQIHNAAGLVTPDGMPLVWLLKSAGFEQVSRVYGPDLMLAVFSAGEARGYRHVFYGATETTLALLQESFRRRFPRAHIVDSIAPAFRPLSPAEDEAHVARINQVSPDIVWIGLGTPKQEQWMADHRGSLTASVLIGVGAAFDMHAGVVPQAPPFVQKIGLEWAFRLYTEPRRLWRRYLRNNPQFIADVFAQKTGLRRFDDAVVSRKSSGGRQ